jgi:hypothetical protein
MAEILSMVRERVDDLPILWAHLDRLGGNPYWTSIFPRMATGWACVWGGSACSGWPLSSPRAIIACTMVLLGRSHGSPGGRGAPDRQCPPRDGGNDRLATVPAALSDARRGRAWAGALNPHVRRVSDRQPACVRLESSHASAVISPPARVQQRRLALLDCPVAISTRLCLVSHQPP